MKIHLYQNENGPDIGSATGRVIQQDGLYFKDGEGTGKLLPYEDWRLDPKERAADLASRLSVDEMLGLMMYSPHQMVPAVPMGPGRESGTYNGKSVSESDLPPYALTDQQKDFLTNEHIRYILAVVFASTEIAARWTNELQAMAEGLPHSIPVNLSSDPRNGAGEDGSEEFRKAANAISKWPEGLGMAATFRPDLVRTYASMISREYRALGITTALSPQADLFTEPRWMRGVDTFGPSPELVCDMVQAYCDGFQTTEGAENGWGRDSVSTMVKHWPGGGPMEAGRDAHYPFGKYAVYPGRNVRDHLHPFLDGAFALKDGTGKAGAVMPYYSVGWDYENSGIREFAEEWKKNHPAAQIDPDDDLSPDAESLHNVGNSYSRFIIHDLLRGVFGYDEVVCTDWGITQDPGTEVDCLDSHCFGVEKLTQPERILLLIENGVDQFGGNSVLADLQKAYALGVKKHGEKAMRRRVEKSAARLLVSSFRCGLFENPYLDPEECEKTAGCREFMDAGFDAQKKSVVMLKNTDGTLPLDKKCRVFVPERLVTPPKTFFRSPGGPSYTVDPLKGVDTDPYFVRVSSPEEADCALVFIDSPKSECYDPDDAASGGNGYLPISLQYGSYHAESARKPSIAGGDFREDFTDRSYRGKEALVYNRSDLELLGKTRKEMGARKVITVIRMNNPMVMKEVEPLSDAILVHFGVLKKAILELLSGNEEPSGLLPVQLPASMETVEAHEEDVPFDMEPYTDACGNTYDFGFGMNFAGPIQDGRADRYRRKK